MPTRVTLWKIVIGILVLALAYYVLNKIAISIVLHH